MLVTADTAKKQHEARALTRPRFTVRKRLEAYYLGDFLCLDAFQQCCDASKYDCEAKK
jgi:hypothetical protein